MPTPASRPSRLPTRRLRGLTALVGAAVVVAGCSAGESVDTGEGGPSPAATGGTLRAAISGTPDQYDPQSTSAYPSFQVLENVYDTLVVPNAEDLTFEPSLATAWTTSDDQLTWTFTLRDDVTFSDGTEFDSADVVYSFRRIVDEELANAYRFATVESVEAPDPRTVVMTLSAPTPNLLSNVGAFKGTAILPEDAATTYDLTREAVGTGPFTLESADAGGVRLAANPDYWGEAPGVDAVDIRFVPESAAALTALRNGDVDWTDNVPPQNIASLEDDDAVELGRGGSVDYWYLAFNPAKQPFGDRDFRRGVAFALDREVITEAAKFGAATASQTPVPQGSFWAVDHSPFAADDREEQARRLLEPFRGTRFGLMVTDEYPETVASAQVVADQLSDYGLTVDLQTVDFTTWLARQGEGDFDAFSLGWLGNVDPFDFYQAQHATGGGFNFQQYSNPQVDDLLARAARETDPDARKGLYDEAARIIVDDVSYLYLYNPDVVHAWSPRVSGYQVRADKAINFETVSLG